MTRWRLSAAILVAATVVAVGLFAGSAPAGNRPAQALAAAPLDRYSLVNGCYALRATPGSGGVLPAGPFRMQAASLGQYLLYGSARNFLAAGATPAMVASPSGATVWQVDGDATSGFTIANAQTGTKRAVSFRPAAGCATYPEASVDATGVPFSGPSPQAQVSGTIDAHVHVTGFELFGGEWHCGRPWDQFGAPFALPDCKTVQQGTNGLVESFLDYGAPGHRHDTVGWPTFHDWPSPTDLAEEGTYYTGMKRAWMAGLRVMVTQLVENEGLCTVMSQRRNPCNDMASVRVQAADLRRLQDYIDAQSGGPGQGFFRIVTNPFQARQVINQGKLAVVEGVEVSHVLDCGEYLGTPDCSQAKIDSGLQELHRLGVSTFFPVHKFDNAFGGTKMDGGTTGVIVNHGNHLETGHYWSIQTCKGAARDSQQSTVLPSGAAAQLINGPVADALGGGPVPLYPPAPHCNTRGLTALGTYLLDKMMQQHFIVELDHMDVKTADQTLSLLEAHRYSGVISAHSWDSPEENPRIYNLGGFVTPIAGSSPAEFIDYWRGTRTIRNPRFFSGTGFGYGADMNGLAEQSQPAGTGGGHPISYPFTAFEGGVSFGHEIWGQRVFDLNKDGVANYGMYPDWLQELNLMAGPALMSDMFHGAEAYLQMWERAYGVPAPGCFPGTASFGARGLGPLRLGLGTQAILYGAGQPSSRPGRAYRYCVTSSGGQIAAVFGSGGRLSFVTGTPRSYRVGGLAPGSRVAGKRELRRLRRSARSLGHGVWLGRQWLRGGSRYVFVIRRGVVRSVGVVARGDARSARAVRADVRFAGVA